jgi:hypothetical protein
MQQQQIEWRRAKVMELLSKGESNQSEIARVLQVRFYNKVIMLIQIFML